MSGRLGGRLPRAAERGPATCQHLNLSFPHRTNWFCFKPLRHPPTNPHHPHHPHPRTHPPTHPPTHPHTHTHTHTHTRTSSKNTEATWLYSGDLKAKSTSNVSQVVWGVGPGLQQQQQQRQQSYGRGWRQRVRGRLSTLCQSGECEAGRGAASGAAGTAAPARCVPLLPSSGLHQAPPPSCIHQDIHPSTHTHHTLPTRT